MDVGSVLPDAISVDARDCEVELEEDDPYWMNHSRVILQRPQGRRGSPRTAEGSRGPPVAAVGRRGPPWAVVGHRGPPC